MTVAPCERQPGGGGNGDQRSSQSSMPRMKSGMVSQQNRSLLPKGTVLTEELDVGYKVWRGGKDALFIELAVIGQRGLRDNTEDLTVVQHGSAVVQAVSHNERHADDGQQRFAAGGLHDGVQSAQRSAMQRVLHQQVVTRVAGEAESGSTSSMAPSSAARSISRAMAAALYWQSATRMEGVATAAFKKSVLHGVFHPFRCALAGASSVRILCRFLSFVNVLAQSPKIGMQNFDENSLSGGWRA